MLSNYGDTYYLEFFTVLFLETGYIWGEQWDLITLLGIRWIKKKKILVHRIIRRYTIKSSYVLYSIFSRVSVEIIRIGIIYISIKTVENWQTSGSVMSTQGRNHDKWKPLRDHNCVDIWYLEAQILTYYTYLPITYNLINWFSHDVKKQIQQLKRFILLTNYYPSRLLHTAIVLRFVENSNYFLR